MFKLIIVDDEPVTLEYLSRILDWNSLGFEIAGLYSDGQQALKHLECENIDLVLSDIKMPVMTGIELSEICHKKFPSVNFVFLSAYRDFEYARCAIKYNVKDYVLKPISYNALYKSIETIAEQMETTPLTEVVQDDDSLFAKQLVFSDLLCGITTDENVLNERLTEVGLNTGLLDCSCVLLNININKFFEYISVTWKHGYNRFYNAINILLREFKEVDFIVTRYCHSNIEVVSINIDNIADFHKNTKKYCTTLEDMLLSVLNITSRIEAIGHFDSLKDLIKQPYQSTIEDIAENEALVNKAISYINKHYAEDLSLYDVANHVSLSPAYFSSYFKQQVNENFVNTVNKVRIEKAKELLKNENVKPSIVYRMVGYKSCPYFYKIFKVFCNITPAEYQKKFSKNP